MIEMAAGAAAGALVCLFGMWAFLRGQAAGMDAAAGGRPRLWEHREKSRREDDLGSQVKALFSRPEEPDERPGTEGRRR